MAVVTVGALLTAGLTSCEESPRSAAPPHELSPHQRVPDWNQLHASYVERAKQGKIGLLFLGDSITRLMPQDQLDQRFGKYTPAAFGIAGDTVEDLLERIKTGEVDGLKPKLIVVLIGTNNLGSSSDQEIFRGVKAIADLLVQKCPQSKVMVLGLLPRGTQSDTWVRERVANVNKLLPQLEDRVHVWFMEVGNNFLPENDAAFTRLMPDHLHPSAAGYDVLFGTLNPTIDELLRGG